MHLTLRLESNTGQGYVVYGDEDSVCEVSSEHRLLTGVMGRTFWTEEDVDQGETCAASEEQV